MKITYITKSVAPIGGLERVLCDKMNYLADHGFEVQLITYEQGKHPFVFPVDERVKHTDLGICFFRLYKYSIFKRIILLLRYRRLFKKKLQKLVDKEQPDIIITTTYSMVVADLIANLKTKAKTIIESHVAYYVMRKAPAYSKHFMLKYAAQYYDNRIDRAIQKFDKMVTLTKADGVDWGKHTSNITVIPNPITYYPETVVIDRKTKHRILCAGRLNAQKGFDLLIESFALIASKCPEWHIDIFGNGEDREILLKMIKEKELEKRIFIKEPTDMIYDEYQTSDFFVLSSRYEGFGLVLAEAMACGIPCISFRCMYGPEEIITDKEDGLLVRNGDVHELAEKILWMIEHEDKRLAMGLAARQSATRYKQDFVMQQWIDMFNKLIK
jgi:glycosyltransferase involved in cell wall biosynthesis